MRSSLIDRAVVIWIGAALLVWVCCLAILWGYAFDTSGRSALVTLSATLLALCLAVLLPGRVARTARRLAGWMGASGALAAAGPTRPGRLRDVCAMMRLLAIVAVFAALCGLISTAAVFVGAMIADALAGAMLFSPTGWLVCSLLIQLAGMFPIAVGVAVALLASGMVRMGSGRDTYATVFREWLWALAIALGVFGACWRLGVDVLALAVTMAPVLGGAALAIGARRGATLRPRRIQVPIEAAAAWRCLGVAAAFGAVTLALLLQVRLAGDAAGLTTGGAAGWMGASVALLAGFLRKVDHKSRPPGKRQRIGATIGLCAGLLAQAALLVTALAGGAAGLVACAAAVAAQVPIAALAAVILSRQRRLFASAGGRLRGYLSGASAGAGAAILGYLLAAAIPAGTMIILLGPLVLCAGCVVGGIAACRRARDQLKWAAWGAALLCSLTVAVVGAAGALAKKIGRVSPGVWLTAIGQAGASNPSPQAAGVLPRGASWRGPGVDEALRRLMGEHAGRWLVASISPRDLPDELPAGVRATVLRLDPTAWGRWPYGRRAAAEGGDFFTAGPLGRERFDGILLALMDAEHPQAWRCYNARTMRRHLRRLQAGGVAVFRLRAGDGGLGVALSALRAFCGAAGPCGIVAEHHEGRIDLLAVAPAARAASARPARRLLAVSSRRLWYEWPGVRPLRQWRPRSALAGGPTVARFVSRLVIRRREKAAAHREINRDGGLKTVSNMRRGLTFHGRRAAGRNIRFLHAAGQRGRRNPPSPPSAARRPVVLGRPAAGG